MYTFRAPRIHASIRRVVSLIAIAFLVASLAPTVEAQPPGGVNREQMWYAPTAEDWQKPVLITFQRTWEDAVAVSRETNQAILVCVNMDGEIASEHYAGIRYRQPDIAKLYEPYVCVMASVYRHNPRDYDETGERILCPRFGSVTCGEHIAIEPLMYEKFLDGQRIAPRHIMVELDGSEVYDVFYAWDTDSVFQAIRDGITNREIEPRTIVRGDRPILERVASRHIEDRLAVEAAYRDGDKEMRAKLLEAAREHPEAAPLDLLRLAIFGLDTALSERARVALAQTDSTDATGLILEALRTPMNEAAREKLVAALERLGERSPHAKTLAVVQKGLDGQSQAVDVQSWSSKLATGAASYRPAMNWVELGSTLDDKASATRDRPEDAIAHLEAAEASLAYAVNPETASNLAADAKTAADLTQLMFEDALTNAQAAERLGASGWNVDAVIALASHYLGDAETAQARAEKAVAALPAGEPSWNAMAVLGLYAEGRRQSIMKALRAKEEWPQQWLTDVHSAYSVLAGHPEGTDGQIVAHYDFLNMLAAVGKASRVLQDGLARFPDSAALHDRLRGRVLADRGLRGLEAVYENMLRQENASPSLHWYAGLASLVTAEFHRRKGRDEAALEAYDRAIGHYEKSIEVLPDDRDSAEHYIALSLAGQARVAFERKDDEGALSKLLASFERRAGSAATLDGLNISPADTARTLRAHFTTTEQPERLARLDAALSNLDAELLQLPAYERDGPRPGANQGNQRRPRRNRDGGNGDGGADSDDGSGRDR